MENKKRRRAQKQRRTKRYERGIERSEEVTRLHASRTGPRRRGPPKIPTVSARGEAEARRLSSWSLRLFLSPRMLRYASNIKIEEGKRQGSEKHATIIPHYTAYRVINICSRSRGICLLHLLHRSSSSIQHGYTRYIIVSDAISGHQVCMETVE